MSEQRVSYLVGRSDRVLRTLLEEAFEPFGLSISELTALSVLVSRPGLSNARLARRSLVTPQAMHKVMRSLEERGLVERHSSADGGRALEAVVTSAGVELLAAVEPARQAAEDRFLDALDVAERAELERLLLKMTGMDR